MQDNGSPFDAVKSDVPISPHLHQQLMQHRQHQNQSLPATPKSVSDSNHASSTVSELSATNALNDDDHTVPEDAEYDEKAADDTHEFVLAPTPAQLGRAPLQRRLGSLAINGKLKWRYFCHMISMISIILILPDPE